MTGICLFCMSTFSVLSISESQTKDVKMAPVVGPVLPVQETPTFKPNTSFVKPSEEMKKVEVSMSVHNSLCYPSTIQ